MCKVVVLSNARHAILKRDRSKVFASVTTVAKIIMKSSQVTSVKALDKCKLAKINLPRNVYHHKGVQMELLLLMLQTL